MEQILTAICGELNNWFYSPTERGCVGYFTISNGMLPLTDRIRVKEGQCVRIKGSTFNEGIHVYPVYDLQDETFYGAVTPLDIPPEVMRVAVALQESEAESGFASTSPYTSESFGGYSYTRATDSSGVPLDALRLAVNQRLEKWRKMP